MLSSDLPLTLSVTSLLALIVWRFWKFTVRPYLYPNEPKELPYWLPVIGHAPAFLRSQNAVFEAGREYFKDTKEPFSITVGGQSIYIITSPKDVGQMYKDSSNVSWDVFVKELHQFVCMSSEGLRLMYLRNEERDQKTKHQSLNAVQRIVEFHHQQLYPGENLSSILYGQVLPGMYKRLDPVLGTTDPVVSKRSGDLISVSLDRLCTQAILRPLANAYFGQAIWKVNPAFMEDFMTWERQNWKLLFQLPSIMCGDINTAVESLTDGFAAYYSLSKEERKDSAYFINAVEDLLVGLGMKKKDMGRVLMLHCWAILGNVSKGAFWIAAQIVFDKSLMQDLRAEVMPAMKEGILDDEYLTNNCPVLDSVYQEALRLVTSAGMARDVDASFVVGNKTLKKGRRLLVPFFQLHHNRDVWGSNPENFEAERFVTNPKLARSQSLRIFGGGSTLCAGRFLSRKIIFSFVASLLINYDISTVDGRSDSQPPRFPRVDYSKPSPGVASPVEGDDLILYMQPRSKQ